MLQGPEIHHASVEKEAKAIIEAIRHWRHYLTGRHFTIMTDQRSVAYMFDNEQRGKIKNDMIMRWRTELSCYSFEIVYHPGVENIPPDTLSRSFCAALPSAGALGELHNSLCHPGVTHMFHFVRTRNLPYSIEDVRQMTKACRVCAEHKPQFHSPAQAHLIKATQPFERLNIDFKGPLKSNNQTHTSSTTYMSTVDSLLFSHARMSAHRVSYNAYASSSPSLECRHTSTLIGVLPS